MASSIKSSPPPIHTHLSIRLSSFAVSINAGINLETINPRGAAGSDTPVFIFRSDVEILGECLQPEERAGESYRIKLRDQASQVDIAGLRLKDYRIRNSDGSPKYRSRKGECIPVYDPPKSIGFIERNRGSGTWDCCAWVAQNVISDMLVILPSVSLLYVSIHEVKVGRCRNVRGLSLQMTDPEEG